MMNEQTGKSKMSKEKHVDNALKWVMEQKYSVAIVTIYSIAWYMVGYYVGDFIHWMQDIMA